MGVPEVYAYREQKDQAFVWLNRALVEKDVALVDIKGHPLLENLEADSRYQDFLRKMNFPK